MLNLRPEVALGLRWGTLLGLLGIMHVCFSTMTPMPRPTWGLMQKFYGAAAIFFAGWAGLKAYAATKKLLAAAVAGALTGAVGVILFTAGLFFAAYGLTNQLVQFPFAAEDLAGTKRSIADYVGSAKGFRDLVTASIGSALSLVPMAGGFGYLGAMIVRALDSAVESQA
jgi:hypothetical protein